MENGRPAMANDPTTPAPEITSHSHTQPDNVPQFLGDYEILKAIGKGKFAIVYRARHIKDDLVVAVKRISIDMMNDKAREKCLKEVNLLRNLDHPNIIRYMDSFITDNDLFIVYEWASAGDLKRQLRKAQEKGIVFEERIIWKYFSQICNAMQHMHERRIMHRDLKPANIFLTIDGTIKVGDLGLSRELSEHTVQAHSKVGTPLYMSPEVLKGDGYDFKSDIWSLGCLLYELAMLKSPFKSEGLNLYSLFQKISNGDYQPLPDSFSMDLRQLAYAMISIKPQDRPDISAVCYEAQRMRAVTGNMAKHVRANSFSLMVEQPGKDRVEDEKPTEARQPVGAEQHTTDGDKREDEKGDGGTTTAVVYPAPNVVPKDRVTEGRNDEVPWREAPEQEERKEQQPAKQTMFAEALATKEMEETFQINVVPKTVTVVDDEGMGSRQLKDQLSSESRPRAEDKSLPQTIERKPSSRRGPKPQDNPAVDVAAMAASEKVLTSLKTNPSETLSTKTVMTPGKPMRMRSADNANVNEPALRPKSRNFSADVHRPHDADADADADKSPLANASVALASMDALYGKLLVLGYPMDEPGVDAMHRAAALRCRGRLLPVHFAWNLQEAGQVAGHDPRHQFQQFQRMIHVAVWLAQRIGGKTKQVVERINVQLDSALSVAKTILKAAQESVEKASEELMMITPSSLCHGFGVNVCALLNALADQALAAQKFAPQPLVYPVAPIANINDDGPDSELEESISQSDDDGAAAETQQQQLSQSEATEDSLRRKSILFDHEMRIDPKLWQMETEKVSAVLRQAQQRLAEEETHWRAHVEQINVDHFQQNTRALVETMRQYKRRIETELQQVFVSERALNLQPFAARATEQYVVINKETALYQSRLETSQRLIASLAQQLSDLDDQLDALREQQAHVRAVDDRQTIISLRQAILRLQDDLRQLHISTQMVNQQLWMRGKEHLVALARKRWQTRRKKARKKSMDADEFPDEDSIQI